MIVSYRFVYLHLICEFSHWDTCLSGLVDYDGKKWLCKIINPYKNGMQQYMLHPIDWDEECDKYLNDYRIAYAHWFYENGERLPYDGRNLSWFSKKWPNNPIEDKVKK